MKTTKWKAADAECALVSSAKTIEHDGRTSASVYDAAGNMVIVMCERNVELVERALERLGMVRA